MPNYVVQQHVANLPKEQQTAIEEVLVNAGLLKVGGDMSDFDPQNLPSKNKAAMDAMGIQHIDQNLGFNWGCAAARVGEAAAVAACASVPGGQIAIAACIAAAHALANKACE